MTTVLPEWLDPRPWLDLTRNTDPVPVRQALQANHPDIRELALFLSPAADTCLEAMAQRARAITRRRFGRTIQLYAPLYVSNHCPGGCAYCGFAADRKQVRRVLDDAELLHELDALKALGLEDVLLLTGERCAECGVDTLARAVDAAARRLHSISVETFAMTQPEYRSLVDAGAVGVTLYQETYDPVRYADMHRWGPKQDYLNRLEAPGRALDAGIRTCGLGALLGLGDPCFDTLAMVRHIRHLMRIHWKADYSLSFPRLRPESGGFQPAHPVNDRLLVRIILACRLCLPDVTLTLSTRESAAFRNAMAGIGINRMSVASRTTVGGYDARSPATGGQFDIHDTRDVTAFCSELRTLGLEPVFKNWDRAFQSTTATP